MEAKLQKLKVTELKDLLAKHSLPQTGKKDELVKRLIDNNVSLDDPAEELVDPDADGTDETVPEPAAAPAQTSETPAPAATTESSSTPPKQDLTPEQLAQKARAERFGLPFDPNPKPKSQPAQAAPAKEAATPTQAEQPKKEKAGAIDKTSLGLSDEVLAKRAAKFGLPEKKAAPAAPAAAPAAQAAAPASKKEQEITPEMAEKIAVEEEKKRKRAEKFGTGKPATNGTASTEPDAKKTKVDG